MAKQQRRDWSDLQPDLLGLIFQRLDFMDYVKCREVCWSWRKVVDDAVAKPAPFPFLLCLPPRSLAWLPRSVACTHTYTAKLVSVTQNAVYTFPYKLPRGLRFRSCHGWLIFLKFHDKRDKENFHFLFSFLNPVSASKFKLPVLSYSRANHNQLSFNGCRIVFSAEPHSPQFIVVVHLLLDIEDDDIEDDIEDDDIDDDDEDRQGCLAFYHATHKTWTLSQIDPTDFLDIAILGSKLYAITMDGPEFLTIFDLRDPNDITAQRLAMIDDPVPMRMVGHVELKNGLSYCRDYEACFLVADSTHGELLLVFIQLDTIRDPEVPDECASQVKGFRVFKLDMSGRRWLKVDSLDDRILLVQVDGVQLVSSAKHISEIIGPNCIFFFLANKLSGDLFPMYDLGVYSLTDKSIKRFPPDASLQAVAMTTARWFTPCPL